MRSFLLWSWLVRSWSHYKNKAEHREQLRYWLDVKVRPDDWLNIARWSLEKDRKRFR